VPIDDETPLRTPMCRASDDGPGSGHARRRRDAVTALVLHASTDRHDEWGGSKRYVRVIVHDTTDELRQAADRYRHGLYDYSWVGACFHSPADRERHVDGKWRRTTDPHWGGIIRLSREYMNDEVVVHECVHAALAIYRMDVRSKVVLGSDCTDREETLAYITGDLTSAVATQLHDAGVW
jgi:hypothetical protein